MSFSNFTYVYWIIPAVVLIGLGYYFSLVDRPKGWKIASVVCRVLAILFILLGLCRPYFSSSSDKVHVAFLLDGSASVSIEGMEQGLVEIEKSIAELESTDSYSLYLFASQPKQTSTDEIRKYIELCKEHGGDADFRAATTLSPAVLGSRLEFPSDKSKRLVIFSDGNATDENVKGILQGAQSEGVDVKHHQVASLAEPEAAVLSFEALTGNAFEGEIVRMRGVIQSNESMNCVARLLNRGVEVQRVPVKLSAGEPSSIGFDVEMTISGATSWTLEIEPEKDYFSFNNSVSATVLVSGTPRVLVIHQKSKEMRSFSRAMRKQGIELDMRGAKGLPQSLNELMAFKAIVLADVPATDLTMAQMRNLKRYVGDFGGGLVMLGSENSFGIGGYYGTPVDEVLPLTSRYEKEKQKPSMAMALVIDKSGSMDGMPIQLARQAAKAAVDLLGVQDSIAVVGFDSNAQTIVEMTSASAKGSVQDAIDTLDASGGTNLEPAMQRAKEMLERSPAKIKHMIILSDGQTAGSGFIDMAQEMAGQSMTISTVALGEGAAKDLMQSIASEGKGRYYETDDPVNMPQIFTKETMQASRSAIKEDIYSTALIGEHPMTNGFEAAEFPFVMGYVMTKPRPTATLVLAAETGDPLLAVNRYGLGSSIAYASDLTEKWGAEWLGWSAGAKFWSQALRSVLRKENGQGIQVSHTIQQDRWALDVIRKDDGGRLVDNVEWRIQAMDENGDALPVSQQQNGVGSYAISVELGNSSKAAVLIQDPADGRSKTLYWDRPYPKEYVLNAEPAPEFAELPSISASSIRQDLPENTIDQEAQSHFFFIGISFLIAGVLMRRI